MARQRELRRPESLLVVTLSAILTRKLFSVRIVPVTRDKRVIGVITRSEFFHRLASRFLETL